MERINKIKFGSIEIGQNRYRHDVVIFPGGEVRRRKGGLGMIGTHGIKKEEVAELVKAGAQTILVGKGIFCRAKLHPQAEDFIREAKIELTVLSSKEAVNKFNELARNSKPLGAIFHVTC